MREVRVFFPIEDWLASFALTLLVEIPIVMALLGRIEPDIRRLAVLPVLANLASHPVVWFVLTQVLLVGTLAYVVVAEAFAIGVEALVYITAVRALAPGRALAISFVANAASVVAGVVLLGLEVTS